VKSILISGCSTGIGRAAALHFAAKGYRTFAGVRKESDAQSLSQADSSGNIKPVLLDVTNAEQLTALVAALQAELRDAGLDALVNNAGIGKGAPLEYVDAETVRAVFEVNVMGPLLLTRALLPLIRKAKGRIVTIGSIGGKVAMAINGVYSMSKFAIEAFGDTLRKELAPEGIHVALIEPGPIRTPMLMGVPALIDETVATLPNEARARYGTQIAGFAKYFADVTARALPPAAVAGVIEHAVESPRPRARYVVTRDAKMVALLHWLLPDHAFDAVSARLTRAEPG
jgi:NAD(P)-dependent dehydrogenase (short-subunit alcohol dehydrogenase family)